MSVTPTHSGVLLQFNSRTTANVVDHRVVLAPVGTPFTKSQSMKRSSIIPLNEHPPSNQCHKAPIDWLETYWDAAGSRLANDYFPSILQIFIYLLVLRTPKDLSSAATPPTVIAKKTTPATGQAPYASAKVNSIAQTTKSHLPHWRIRYETTQRQLRKAFNAFNAPGSAKRKLNQISHLLSTMMTTTTTTMCRTETALPHVLLSSFIDSEADRHSEQLEEAPWWICPSIIGCGTIRDLYRVC